MFIIRISKLKYQSLVHVNINILRLHDHNIIQAPWKMVYNIDISIYISKYIYIYIYIYIYVCVCVHVCVCVLAWKFEEKTDWKNKKKEKSQSHDQSREGSSFCLKNSDSWWHNRKLERDRNVIFFVLKVTAITWSQMRKICAPKECMVDWKHGRLIYR